MKEIISTTLFFLTIGFGVVLIAQQSNDQKIDLYENKDIEPDVQIKVQKEMDEEGNITTIDSTYSWSWSGEGDIPWDVQEQFRNLFENIDENFSFHLNDSSLHEHGFYDLFDNNFDHFFEDFQWKFQNFHEEHMGKIQEKFENLFNEEFQLKWDEQQEKHQELLQERFKELEDKIWEFHQRYDLDNHPRSKAL